jgi:hypothetical protein
MKKLLAAGAVAGLLLLGGGAMPATAVPLENRTCPALDSGKIDVTGSETSITFDAPAGTVITGYCVKAGPVAEFVEVDPPQTSVTIELNGKEISHFSVQFGTVTPES